MAADDVLQREEGSLQIDPHFLFGRKLDRLEKSVEVIRFGCVLLHFLQPLADHLLQHELPDVLRVLLYFSDLPAVEHVQEREEVEGVSLVHLVEDIVEVSYEVRQFGVVFQVGRAEVPEEDVSGDEAQLLLDVHGGFRDVRRRPRFRFEIVREPDDGLHVLVFHEPPQGFRKILFPIHHGPRPLPAGVLDILDEPPDLLADQSVEVLVVLRVYFRERVVLQHVPPLLLQVRPIAERESWGS